MIFVIGTTSFNMKLVYLDNSEGSTFIIQQNLNDQLSQVNFIYQQSNIIIICSSANINAYQFTPQLNQLKHLMKLRDNNQNLCFSSIFKVTQINKTIHIQQIIKRNIGLNIYDTQNNKMLSQSFIAQFADSVQVRAKLSERTQYNYILLENIQLQLVAEFKNLGLVYMYDPLQKNIVNQVRFWYPYSEVTTQLFFNSVAIIDPVYLFVGFEFNTFKIKIINIKTYEISYEQEIPEISVPFNDLSFVLNPSYFPTSDAIIVQFLRKKLTTDTQKRYDFCFIQRNPGNQLFFNLKKSQNFKIESILYLNGNIQFRYSEISHYVPMWEKIK